MDGRLHVSSPPTSHENYNTIKNTLATAIPSAEYKTPPPQKGEDGRGDIMINYSIIIMGTKPGTKKEHIQETKAYGTAQVHEILDMNAFAKHIADHGCTYDRADISAVLTKAVDCLREQMLLGNKVNLGELGSFHVELATRGAKTADTFTAANIEAVNIRWTPGKDFRNLRDEATFQLVPTRAAQSTAVEVVKNQDTIQGLE